MRARNRYEDLDNIGFIGVAEEQAKYEVASDAKRTSEFIRAFHSKSAPKKLISNGTKSIPTKSSKKTRPKLARTK